MDVARQAKSFDENEEPGEELILFRRPDAAPNAADFIKTIPVEETPFIVPDSFAGRVGRLIAQNLTMPQLEMIGAFGDVYLKEAIKVNLVLSAKDAPNDNNLKTLEQYVLNSPAWQQ